MLSFRQLKVADLPALLALQETVRQALSHPHLFQGEDAAYYARVMTGGGAGFGAFDGATLAAYGIVTFPGEDPDNLCREVPHLAIDPGEVAHLDGSAVDPAWRGQGLQQQLSALRIHYAAEKGARHFLMTVSPMNAHSLRNHLNGGFRVEALKQKYGGLWRFILWRSLHAGASSAARHREFCPLDDLDGHHRLLDAGFAGIGLVNREGAWQLEYELSGR